MYIAYHRSEGIVQIKLSQKSYHLALMEMKDEDSGLLQQRWVLIKIACNTGETMKKISKIAD